MSDQLEEQAADTAEEIQVQERSACTTSLPLWIWGTTAFIAGYMLLQLQTFA